MAGLGRGLDSLISSNNAYNSKNADSTKEDALVSIPINVIIPGKYQPRQYFDEESLQELADSILQQGIIQPIVVRPINEDQFEILAGERRWQAAKRVGLQQVPAIIKNVEDKNAIAIAIVENVQRKNLNVIEESLVLKKLVDEFNLTHEEVGKVIGKSRAQVSNLLRLNELEDSVKQMVLDGKLDMGHARALLVLDSETQCDVAQVIANKEMSVRETEKYIKKIQSKKNMPNESKIKDQNLIEWESSIKEKIGCNSFKFIEGNKGSGKFIISYKNEIELENLKNFFNKN